MATLGGVTVPEPAAGTSGHAIIGRDLAIVLEMADGSLKQHFRGTRRQYRVKWAGITAAQRNTLYTRYKVRSNQAWVTADGIAATVQVVPGSWTEASNTVTGGYVWDVGMTLEDDLAAT